jgi:N-acetyl-alpha-D-muramate 1-phosphate uridylyltransferase
VSEPALTAVVMAAGEGQRLRPLTDRWPKPILPLAGRPVVATLLRELAAAGIRRVWIVTGHLAEQVERLVGDGSAFGLDVRFARQTERLGSADALQRALAAGAEPPLLATAADTVYRPGDLARAAETWLASRASGGLGVRIGGGAGRTPVRVEGGYVRAIGEEGSSRRTGAPLWFLSSELTGELPGLAGPPYELAEAFRDALERRTPILALEIGPTRDITRPADVVLENFPYLWTV